MYICLYIYIGAAHGRTLQHQLYAIATIRCSSHHIAAFFILDIAPTPPDAEPQAGCEWTLSTSWSHILTKDCWVPFYPGFKPVSSQFQGGTPKAYVGYPLASSNG